MTSHLDSLVRVSLVLAFALLAMPLLKGRSAVARRLVLSVAFASVLVLPFVPAWEVHVPAYQRLVGRVVVDGIASAAPSAFVAPSPATLRSIDWLALAWAVGAIFVGARFVVGLVRARRIVARASAAPAAWDAALARAAREAGQRAVVCVSSEVEAPAVTGLLSPVVLVPESSASWTDERRLSVLLHELAHVTARDLGVQVLAMIVCSLHWFNPLAWLAARRLRLERELAADEVVLRSGVRASSYAADLLAIAGAAPSGAIAIGAKPLPVRIAAIVSARRPALLGPVGAAALVFGTVAVAFGVACTTNVEPTPPVAAPRAALPAPASAANDLQAAAEQELDRAVHEWKASGRMLLVLTPKGEVLADAGGRSDRVYVTGSTVKTMLLAGAIDEGIVSERDVFDASPAARAAVPELLATSSNVGFSQIFDRLGTARWERTLHRFHFATPPELDSKAAIGATMSGTPRQVARAYAALANGGDGIVKPETAARVTTLLEGVVTSERGTGKRARVAGTRVAGKTGTSDWTEADGTNKTYASFVGYVPADQPRYVIFVGVESALGEGPSGGAVAAPVFARIAERALAR